MMGSRLSGQNMWVAVGIQTAKGTAAYRYFYFQLDGATGILPEFDVIESSRRTGTRFKNPGYRGMSQIPFGFEVELNPGNCGVLLYAGTGTETGVVSGDGYSHAFTKAEELPYCTILYSTAGIADSSGNTKIHRIMDAKLKFSLNMTTDNKVMISIEGIGISADAITDAAVSFTADITDTSTTIDTISDTTGLFPGMPISGSGIPTDTIIVSVDIGTSTAVISNAATATTTGVSISSSSFSTAASAAFTSDTPFFTKSPLGTGKLSIGATIEAVSQYYECRAIELTYDNNMDRDARIDDTATPFGIEEGSSEVTGSLDCVYNGDSYTEISHFQANTNRALKIVLTTENYFETTEQKTLTININEATYTGSPASWDIEVMSFSLPFSVNMAETFSFVLYDNTGTEYNDVGTAIT